MSEVIIKIDGMSCQKCVTSVTAALQGVAGVTQAEVSLAANQAKITFDPAQANQDALCQAIEEAGFDAQPL